jgi:hypothetical protein
VGTKKAFALTGVSKLDKSFSVCFEREKTFVAVVSNLYELITKNEFASIIIVSTERNMIAELVPYFPLLPLKNEVVDLGDNNKAIRLNITPVIIIDKAKSFISVIIK